MNISQGTILFNLIAFLAWFCLRQYFVYRLLLVFSKERFRRGISVTVFVLISLVLLAAELLNLNYLQLQTYAVVELLMLLSAFLLFRSDIVKRFQIIVLTFECLKLIDFFFQNEHLGADVLVPDMGDDLLKAGDGVLAVHTADTVDQHSVAIHKVHSFHDY